MDHAHIRDEVKRFGIASHVLRDRDWEKLPKLVEALKQLFSYKSEAFIKDVGENALLYSYQSDATSYSCMAQAVGQLDGIPVVRKGKVLVGFLMERGFLISLTPALERKVTLLLRDPRPLHAGKAAWNAFTAMFEFFSNPRCKGFGGILIVHLCMDRALFTACARMLHQCRQAYYTAGLGPDLGEMSRVLYLTEWNVSTGCALHDCQSALKWSMAPFAGNGVIDDLHIVL